MRDPQGRLEFSEQHVRRSLQGPLGPDHFLNSQVARALVDDGALIDYTVAGAALVSARTGFVSFPSEWTDAQLVAAAQLTLRLAESSRPLHWELKDASAWNVVFLGTRPQFCDHLSFQPIGRPQWWAFGQFVRHFLLPLCLSKHVGLDVAQSFKLHRDGVPPDFARRLLGLRRFLTVCWPLLHRSTGSKSESRRAQHTPVTAGKSHHANLFAFLRWLLKRVAPRRPARGHWSGYAESRPHYSDEAQRAKHAAVAEWIDRTRPSWVIDYGCNTGEFSVLAASKGCNVVAIDLDHDSVQRLYQTQSGNPNIYALVADLDDVIGGRGWAGEEFPGLVSRLERVGELSLMLALVHHLAISNSIPYEEIAKLARRTSKKWLIVELLEENDPLVRLLCQQRDRDPSEFSLHKQREAFLRFFTLIDAVHVSGTTRHLLLLAALP